MWRVAHEDIIDDRMITRRCCAFSGGQPVFTENSFHCRVELVHRGFFYDVSTAGRGRVVRGGSWGDIPGNCRSASRGSGDPGDKVSSLIGFRLAGTLKLRLKPIVERLCMYRDFRSSAT